jgi:dTDP-4-amino-4,6-dideoxygalactose transaminase
MKKNKFIRFGKPQLGKDEIRSINNVLQNSWIGTGTQCLNFESRFKKYKKSKYALTLNSCTAGLHLSLVSLGLKKGDEVITSSLTFCSTINSILIAGGKPVLVDIRPDTLNLNEELIEKKITKNTKFILPVHFAGMPCEMDKILKIAKKYKLYVVEDCAHAIESKYKNINTGTFGDTGCFSFYANKNITTGEGGMLITNNKKIHDICKTLRLHGMSIDAWKRFGYKKTKKISYNSYDVIKIGYKYNMTDIMASMGIVQLRKINKMWKRRKYINDFYYNELKNLPLKFQVNKKYKVKHGYHLFTIIIDNNDTKRENLLNYLNNKGIGATVHYNDLTEFSAYKKIFKKKLDLPISKYVSKNIISLPIYPDLKEKEMKYVTNTVKLFFKKNV